MSFPIWLEGKGFFPDWDDRIILSRRWQMGMGFLIGRLKEKGKEMRQPTKIALNPNPHSFDRQKELTDGLLLFFSEYIC